MSQQAFADLVGLNRATIANIETERVNPPLHIIYEICNQLDMTLSEFLPTLERYRQAVDAMGKRLPVMGDQIVDPDVYDLLAPELGLEEDANDDSDKEPGGVS